MKGHTLMVSTATLRVLEPAQNILAFYDGRQPNRRLVSANWNWLDDAAYTLGIASYVVFDGNEALVFDTHISVDHATIIRKEIENRGIASIRVVLSHHHRDHVAGTQAFADCEIMSSRKTAEALNLKRESYANSVPPIAPMVMPTDVFDGATTLRVGSMDVELRPVDIHSYDGVSIYIPTARMLLAGDALEDTVTYVAEPGRLGIHLAELDRLSTWNVTTILPSHGDPDRIAQGGYAKTMIDATQAYITKLLLCRDEPSLASLTLSEFVANSLENGSLVYHDQYEAVHRENVSSVLAI